MNQTNKQVEIKNEKDVVTNEYLKFNEILSNKKEINKLTKFMVRFARTFSKRNDREQVSISLRVHDEHMRDLRLNNAGEYLTPTMFNLIKLEANLPLTDERGKPKLEWFRNAPVRFVKGHTNSNSEYHMVQVGFSKESFLTSYLQQEDVRLIQKLESMGQIKIDWVESPEKIDDVERLPELHFD